MRIDCERPTQSGLVTNEIDMEDVRRQTVKGMCDGLAAVAIARTLTEIWDIRNRRIDACKNHCART